MSKDTGGRKWPHGRISWDDDGEIQMRMAADHRHNVIRMEFQKPVVWIALDRETAATWRDSLDEKIRELNRYKAENGGPER